MKLLYGDDAIEQLRLLGCGAWVGNIGCNEPATFANIGETRLYFSAFRRGNVPGPGVLVWTCARHSPRVADKDGWRLTADMPPDVRRRQEAERQKYVHAIGRPEA